MISPGDSEWSGAAGLGNPRDSSPAQHCAVQFLGQIVAELVGLVHAAFHLGDLRVGCAGRACPSSICHRSKLARCWFATCSSQSSAAFLPPPASAGGPAGELSLRASGIACHATVIRSCSATISSAEIIFSRPSCRPAFAAAGFIVEQPPNRAPSRALPAGAEFAGHCSKQNCVESGNPRPRVVSSLGIEPRTHALKGRCSTN